MKGPRAVYRPGLSGLSSVTYTGEPWIIDPTYGLASSNGGLRSGVYGLVSIDAAVSQVINLGTNLGNFVITAQNTSGNISAVVLKDGAGNEIDVTINLAPTTKSFGKVTYAPFVSALQFYPAAAPAPTVAPAGAPAQEPIALSTTSNVNTPGSTAPSQTTAATSQALATLAAPTPDVLKTSFMSLPSSVFSLYVNGVPTPWVTIGFFHDPAGYYGLQCVPNVKSPLTSDGNYYFEYINNAWVYKDASQIQLDAGYGDLNYVPAKAFPPLDPEYGYVLFEGETLWDLPGALNGAAATGGFPSPGWATIFTGSNGLPSIGMNTNPPTPIASIPPSSQYDRWEFLVVQVPGPQSNYVYYQFTFKDLVNGQTLSATIGIFAGGSGLSALGTLEDIGIAIAAGGLVNLAVGGAVGVISGASSAQSGQTVTQAAEQSAIATAAVSAAGMAAGAVDLAFAPAAATVAPTTAADGSLFAGSDTLTATSVAADTSTATVATTATAASAGGAATAGGSSALLSAATGAAGVVTKAATVIGGAAVTAAIADVTGKKPAAIVQSPTQTAQAAGTAATTAAKSSIPTPLLIAGAAILALGAKAK